MNKLILSLLFLLPLKVRALELKVGDVLLQPLQCWTCYLIMAQENSAYSHMGLVVATKPSIKIAEALGSVRLTSLEEFRGRTKNQKLSVRRFKDADLVNFIQLNSQRFLQDFKYNYEGLPYDQEFLWDNFDTSGNEKLYCSEMVSKMLTGFLGIAMPAKRMKYDINREHWTEYFKGNPPDGKWGNAPADFEKSNLFYEVGEL